MNLILEHYKTNWNNIPNIKSWDKGPINRLTDGFKILEFPPNENRRMWTYATMGMSNMKENNPIELHVFSSKQDDALVELLTSVAYYHQNTAHLELDHTVNFGKSWQDNSICKYGLVSLPYMDGPSLENLYLTKYDENLKFLWLVPLTEDEVNYKKKNGVEALEEKLEKANFNYLDANRKSVLDKRKGFSLFG